MRPIRYSVAASLDAYIAGPNGESDWIILDPEIDFTEMMSGFDTVLMGRRTFQTVMSNGFGLLPGMTIVVVSRTSRAADYPDVTIVADELEEALTGLRMKPGKDIWLFGGGSLFRSLLAARLVTTIEVAVIPLLLGGGIPLFPAPAQQTKLKLVASKTFKTGILALEYAIDYQTARSRRQGTGWE